MNWLFSRVPQPWWFSVVAGASLLLAIGYGFYVSITGRDLGGSFWEVAVAQFVAAGLAIAIGVPAGLWVNEFSHRSERREQQAVADEMRQRTLESLAYELRQAGEMIDGTKGRVVPVIGPSRIAWDAASHSGSLSVIEPKTLALLVKAYRHVDELSRSHQRYVETFSSGRGTELTPDGSTSILDVRRRLVNVSANEARPVILEAVEHLDDKLKEYQGEDEALNDGE